MPLTGTLGEITVKSEQDVEWKICNFMSYAVRGDDCYTSPQFTISNCKWYFKIYMNDKDENSAEWISLFLFVTDSSSNRGATWNFGVKKCDGKVEKVHSNFSWIFKDSETGYGSKLFLEKSKLVARKLEFAPSDVFTITCTLWVYDNFNSTSTATCLPNNFLEMFTSQTACDATLRVRGKTFSVHKFVLMARSPVFRPMFEAPMKEKSTGVVNIEDCRPAAFKDFLVYLYSGRLQNLSNHMYELLNIADKYDVQDLKSHCEIALMGNLSVKNISDAVILADKFNVYSIKQKAQYFFNENYAKIFRTSNWVKFMKQQPELANGLLLKMPANLK